MDAPNLSRVKSCDEERAKGVLEAAAKPGQAGE
jgi:hypothetical protein